MKSRSIILSFRDGATMSDLDFLQRLSELRERYPTCRISGVLLPGGRALVPRRPAAGPTKTMEADPGAEVEAAAPYTPLSVTTDESEVNCAGEQPRHVHIGLRVRILVPPYEGRDGIVCTVAEGRFQVDIAEGAEGRTLKWWCQADDVVVDDGAYEEEPCTSLSTLEENRKLQHQNDSLRAICELQQSLIKSMMRRHSERLSQLPDSECEIVAQLKKLDADVGHT